MSQRRFIRRGVARFHLLLDVADPESGPTRQEIQAGNDVTDFIAAVSGFSLTNTSVPTPDMGSTFDSSIPGTDAAEASSFTFYEDEDTEEAEELVTKGQQLFVFIMRKGDKPGSASGDLFPARVASRTPQYTADNTAAQMTANFNITGLPHQDLPIPPLGGGG